MTTLNPSRRGLLLTAATLSGVALAAACSDTATTASSNATASAGGSYDDVINSGPVASDDVVAASTWASAVRAAGTLRVGGTKTSRVFSLEDVATGQVTGFDAGITQLLARYILGGDDARALVTLTQVSSDTRETMLENGNVDTVVATYTITPERAEKISFAGPYYSSGQVVAVKADNTDITGPADLTSGVRVAVQSNSTSVTAVDEAAPDATQVPLTDDATCVAALESGQVDAYVVDQSLLLSNIANGADIKIVGDPFTQDPYGIGLPKGSDAQAFVNAFLTSIEEDDTWASLWEVTIGQITAGAAPKAPVIGSVDGARTTAPTA